MNCLTLDYKDDMVDDDMEYIVDGYSDEDFINDDVLPFEVSKRKRENEMNGDSIEFLTEWVSHMKCSVEEGKKELLEAINNNANQMIIEKLMFEIAEIKSRINEAKKEINRLLEIKRFK